MTTEVDKWLRSKKRSSLTSAEVRTIRKLAASGVPHKTIAEDFDTSPANISLIVARKRWARVL